MPHATSTKWTYEDLLLLPEDGLRHEIIDGEHYVNASPITRHQQVLYRLVIAVGNYLEEHPLGQIFFAPLDIVLSPHDVVEPDLMFISHARREIVTVNNIQGAPDLLIEVLSPSNKRYDEVTKHALYERTGVGEYWIVDAVRNIVRVFRRNAAGRYEIAGELSNNDTLTSPLFPTLDIRLSRIFRD